MVADPERNDDQPRESGLFAISAHTASDLRITLTADGHEFIGAASHNNTSKTGAVGAPSIFTRLPLRKN
jgi:hypothetical protein